MREEATYFTSFYLYSLTRGIPQALQAQTWPRITRFDDRWRWIVTSIVPRFRRFDADTGLADVPRRPGSAVRPAHAVRGAFAPCPRADRSRARLRCLRQCRSGADARRSPSAHARVRLGKIVAASSPGVIASVDDGHGLSVNAAGVADVTSHRPLRPTDRFRAGSNTKTMVAAVALQLVAEGQLSLSDTVSAGCRASFPTGSRSAFASCST